jgi:DnaK suppressor protein
MRKREVERYRTLLESQLAGLVGQGESAVHEFSGGVATEELPDPADRATVEEGRNRVLRFRDRDRKLIDKIQHALARIEEGSFGRCEACGEPISPARLAARPVTTLCLGCKTEAERRER